MPVSDEILDMYAQTRPSVADALRGEIRSIERSLQSVAETRIYLAEQMKKCDAAEAALSAKLAEAREAVSKLEMESV